MKSLLISIMMLTSCGGSDVVRVNNMARQVEMDRLDTTFDGKHDPVFNEWTALFERDLHVKVDVPIFFSSRIQGPTGAVCSYSSMGDRGILVNLAWWRSPPPPYTKHPHVYRELVIFHELGHCVLNISKHRDGSLVFQTEEGDTIQNRSIMNAVMGIDPDHYMKNREYYISELGG